jgi:DNA replication protein DnaC
VLIISAYNLLELVRKAYFSNEERAEELSEIDVLMIDDLGSEPLMQNVTVEQLFNLLNERLDKGLSTVISTNLTMEELQGRYTERIASRLRDKNNWKVITLEGKDIRS